ncbi:MAG: hypothetical protein ACW98X_16350 [Promethearchaeota archaeon]|jgi:hypothetical protein
MGSSMKRIFIVISSILIFLQVLSFISPIQAQEQPPISQINPSFILNEYANDLGQKSNESSVNIDIPSSTWNLSSININFTSIKMGSETVTLEEDETGFETIRRNYFEILGIQLNITEQTTIFAVEIFGYKSESSSNPGPVYVRIEGWNSGSRRPNGVVYGEQIELNLTKIPGWHIQTFNSPINLSPGFYCLVLDGSSAASSDRYYWYINNDNLNSLLYMCRYDDDESEWLYRNGDVFLHKIKRQVNRSYHPEDINMTLRIENIVYPVQNGGVIGTGNISISNLNFSPDNFTLNILVLNNISVELLLSYNYQVSIQNSFEEKAKGLIRQDSNIQWTLQPSILRFADTHSVKFNFPKNWFNFSILRDSVNITSQISLNYSSNLLYFPNSTIINGATWKIISSSPNIDFQLNVPKSKFGPNQDIIFSLQEPVMQGNYTIILYNSLGFLIDTLNLQIPSDTNLYQYRLSPNPEEGVYRTYIFWNNATDAGLMVYEFQIEVPFTVPIEIIYGILVIISSIIIISITSLVLVKRKKRINGERRQKIYNEYMDALNIQHFIVSDKNSGLSIYDQIIAGDEMDASLISGFLQAIRGFGIELTKSRHESQTIKLEYQDSKILMSEFKDFRFVFIMKDNPSEAFIKSVDVFSKEVDDKLGKFIENFDGELSVFKGIRKILEDHFQVALIYPQRMGMKKKVKVTQNEKSIIKRALNNMEQKESDYFYVSSLFGRKSKFQVKDAEDIVKLIKKNVFIPIIVSPQ